MSPTTHWVLEFFEEGGEEVKGGRKTLKNISL